MLNLKQNCELGFKQSSMVSAFWLRAETAWSREAAEVRVKLVLRSICLTHRKQECGCSQHGWLL